MQDRSALGAGEAGGDVDDAPPACGLIHRVDTQTRERCITVAATPPIRCAYIELDSSGQYRSLGQ